MKNWSEHKKDKLKPILIILTCVVLLDLLCCSGYWWMAHKVVGSEKQGHRADAAFVFFNDFSADKKGLGPLTTRSLRYAASLYQQDKIGGIVCLGGARPEVNRFASEFMKSELVKLGAPESDIYTEKSSYETFSNIQSGLRIAAENNWKRILLISAPLHLFRLSVVFSSQNVIAIPSSPGDPKPQSFRDYVKLGWQIHHEWLAWIAATLIPDDIYRKVLRKIRRS